MAYIANTTAERDEMLAAIGVADVEELFRDVPAKILLRDELPIGPGLSEYETLRRASEYAARNRPAGVAYLNFMGAGSYEHFIPSAVSAIAQRGEILTAYTPYQAEASQGTLQIIFEFQSMICSLTGMDAANASMYDGASALAEAALMAVRINGRNQILLPGTLHPRYRKVVESYLGNLGIEILTWAGSPVTDPATWPAEADNVAALVIPQPNFWGCLEDAPALAAAARERGAAVIAVANPMSLSVLAAPGDWGADIVCGECQPIGLPMNFGGPYAGYLAARSEHLRKMPGRIVGRTEDHEGRGGFVLTLQTREQHIRRERATSNICTNQGLCATMVTLWLSLIGRDGFEKLGRLNLAAAQRLHAGMTALPGVTAYSDAPFFNEFTIRVPGDAGEFQAAMRKRGILAGLPAARLGGYDRDLLILCATETKTESDIDRCVSEAGKVLASE